MNMNMNMVIVSQVGEFRPKNKYKTQDGCNDIQRNCQLETAFKKKSYEVIAQLKSSQGI